jgi:hypothetical protein
MDWCASKKLRKPKEYTPIAQLPVDAVESGWGHPVMVPKGALHELESNYRALILEAHELKRELRKVLKASTASDDKRNARSDQLRLMTGTTRNSSKKRKPFVDPTIWESLEEPVKEALRGLYGLTKHDGLIMRCKVIIGIGMLHIVGDGQLVKLLQAKHQTESKFSNQGGCIRQAKTQDKKKNPRNPGVWGCRWIFSRKCPFTAPIDSRSSSDVRCQAVVATGGWTAAERAIQRGSGGRGRVSGVMAGREVASRGRLFGGSGVRRLCHGQELTAAAGPRPKQNRAEERQCCVVRAYQVKRLVKVEGV